LDYVKEKGFDNIKEETNRLKNMKRKVFSKLSFYSKIHPIETNRPK